MPCNCRLLSDYVCIAKHARHLGMETLSQDDDVVQFLGGKGASDTLLPRYLSKLVNKYTSTHPL